MATTVKRKAGTKPPISAHPVFPAIVALWFAALFGIGSLVLPTVLLEKIVVALGLPAVIAATAPPLGLTARMAIAVFAALSGAFAGVVIARKIVAAQGAGTPRVRSRRTPEEGAAKRPIVATEELGEEGLGPVADFVEDDEEASPAMPGRRRALAVTDDSGRSEYLSFVPLPGEDMTFPVEQEPEQANEDEPFELSIEASPEDDSQFEDGQADLAADEPEAEGAAMSGAVVGSRPFDVPANFEAEEAAKEEDADEERYNPFAGFGAGEDEPADHAAMVQRLEALAGEPDPALAELSMSALIDRFASAIERADDGEIAGEAEEAVEEALPEFAEISFDEEETDEVPAEDIAEEAVPFTFQRGMSAAAASPAQAEPADASEIAAASESDPVAEDEAPSPFGGSFGPVLGATMPPALKPLDLGEFEEEDEDEDPFASGLTLGAATADEPRKFNLPVSEQRPFGVPVETAEHADDEEGEDAPAVEERQVFKPRIEIEPEPEDAEDDFDAEGYSSLLSMKNALGGGQREFVRIEDDADGDGEDGPEPVVTFPGQSGGPGDAPQGRPFDAPDAEPRGSVPAPPPSRQADPAETERQLREALEKLQRMSGAA